jgi:pseudouridine synthase
VNGKLVESPDYWVDLERDNVTMDGKPVRASKRIYLMLYKPKGYITTYKDPRGRPTVYDLIEDAGQWVVPVGRLDQDTSGLLLLTNDTRFAELVTNPDYTIPKTYLVKTSTRLTGEQIVQLQQGVILHDGPTRPAIVKRLRDSVKYSFIEITIREGRNRQVRRMIEVIGSKVLKLVRTAIGGLRIDDLPIGKYRELSQGEIKMLAPQGLRYAKLWPPGHGQLWKKLAAKTNTVMDKTRGR